MLKTNQAFLKRCQFHPYEVAFCGSSNSGKTTLISKLIKEMKDRFDIGYLKHDAHRFVMDRDGKDTHRCGEAGASAVAINDSERLAFLANNPPRRTDFKSFFIDCDILLVEGYKNASLPKIVFCDQRMMRMWRKEELTNVIAFVGQEKDLKEIEGLPVFNRNAVQEICEFLIDHFQKATRETPVYGLVLAGGKSKRMGTDKGALEYNGAPQVRHVYSILERLCEETYVSCREEQKELDHLKGLPKVYDAKPGGGPTAAILGAMEKCPQAAWFVLACDLPHFSFKSAEELISKRNPLKTATSFYNQEKQWPEPLCAIYEPKAYFNLMRDMALGTACPRKTLMNSNVYCHKVQNELAIQNANTQEDREKAIGLIQEQ